MILYATATVSTVVEMGRNGGGYIILDVIESLGKPVENMPMTSIPQIRLDLIEGIKMGDKVKVFLEVEKGNQL